MGCVTSYCDDGTLPVHSLNYCDIYKLGGTANIIIGACGTTLPDPTDTVAIAALVAAGSARKIQKINFTIPASAPINIDNPVGDGPAQKVINADRTAVFTDPNVSPENVDFYNTLNNGKAIGWILAKGSNSGQLTYIEPEGGITVYSDLVDPTKTELKTFQGTFFWQDLEMPAVYTMVGDPFA
jgi:hypothetical protein